MVRSWLLLVVVVTACQNQGGDDEYDPIGGGGGGGTGTGSGAADAAVDGSDAGPTMINGRVCVTADLRRLAPCAITGAGGLTVQLGSQMATTADNGSFQIATPSSTNLTWRVSGGTIVPSLMGFGITAVIPAIDATAYSELLTAHGILLAQGEGSILAHVVKANAPVVGVTAMIDQPQVEIFYDGPTALAWTQIATGAFGTTWIPRVPVGTANVTIGTAPPEPILVEDQAITYVTIEHP